MAKDKYDNGIDVSHWQGEINWQKVKEVGINFAIAKVTGGSDYQDPKFLSNWVGMKNNNIKAAAYHYLKGYQLPESQITNIKEALVAKCDFDVCNDILAIDVEEKLNENVGPEQMADTLYGLLVALNKTFNNIYIYCSPNYWENKVAWQKYDFSPYKLWIAHWTKEKSPTIPTTWQDKGWVWWQHSSKGRIDGIVGDVDLDRSHLFGIAPEYD
ncbi:glycoside hydrolase family 25 protein [Candidatus Tisiphia endosymbiont of Nemotelus uliginosus]|uniref:glycoside hydrolase family 25 protein n=1 Tax=Candidatus Tisiphia endosymbiont of Nemotelus uliginosus TaxID=3077926 RepID=UPI0035C8D8E8